MDQNLGKALENLATRSAWTLDEAVLLLTGKTSSEIESALSKCPPWPINTKWILMRKTKTVELGAGRAAHFKKGEITPTSEDMLKRLISDGSGEEAEAPYDLKQEREDYSKAQDQSKLLETLKRAVLDNDIKSLNDSCRMLQPPEWRLEGKSFVDWVHARKEDISPLRHFPGNTDDVLLKMKKGSRGGRPPFPYKEQVKQAVEKLLKRRPDIQQGKVPYMPEVINVFAPSKGAEADSDMSAKEYKNHFGWAVSTIENIIAEVYKTRL